MAANAIYFPYINVPPDPWLLRMLLYWDRLSAIVPMDYMYEPERFEPRMREMVIAGLVNPVSPGMYLGGIDGFGDAFLRYAERWRSTRDAQSDWPWVPIHAEKLDQLVMPLIDLGVARTVSGGPWYEMPERLANRFMALLATALGQIDEIDAAPVTQNTLMAQPLWRTKFGARRDALLEILFPMPADSEEVSLDDIVAFKAAHQALAARFRERVQQECTLLPQGDSAEERLEQIQALGRRLQGEVDEIADAMRHRWKKIAFGKVLPVLAPAIPLIDATLPSQIATYAGGVVAMGLAGYQAHLMHAADGPARRRPLAYVALAQRRLFAARPRP